MLQLTYELRPKWNKNKNNNKTQNAVSRPDPLQGSDKNYGQLSFLQICVSVISFNLVLLIQTICSQIIVIDNYFANFSNFVLQIFVQDKFCILLFHIGFICKLSFQTFFCHKLFLSCGLGQGCPGGPGLQDLNQQII